MPKYKCSWCEYTGNETEFLDRHCPACCADNITGETDNSLIPLVFHYKEKGDTNVKRISESN